MIYAPGQEDQVLVAGMLERKRDDIVRSAVLQLHTSIEDMPTHFEFCRASIDLDQRERGKARDFLAIQALN
jgi:hypothetical protein